MKNALILLALTIILVGVCGCTQIPGTSPATIPSTLQTTEPLPVTTFTIPYTTGSVSDNTVQIKNFAFDPSSITVKVSSTVRWVNQDSVIHRISFADGTDSQVLDGQQSWSRRFFQPGTYNYTCAIHPINKGTVIVEL